MKVEEFDGSDERAVLTACIVSKAVLSRIAPRYAKPMCDSRHAEQVLKWCVDYYTSYSDAPGKAVEGLFSAWARSGKDRDSVSLIEQYLASLSGEYERLGQEVNAEHMIDVAGKYFHRAKLRRLRDALEASLSTDDLTKADELLQAHHKIELAADAGADIFTDEMEMEATFADPDEVVLEFDGALGEFYGQCFARDCFVSYMAAEGTGKSFYLLDCAWRAMLQRKRVAYFECGDMSKNQLKRRFYCRAAKHPWRAKTVNIPTTLQVVETVPVLEHEARVFTESLDLDKAKKACARVMKSKVRSGNSYLKLSCHETGTLGVHKARSIMDGWERSGWTPDIVIFDYADIMCSTRRYDDKLHETAAIWEELRALAIGRHCCVITATQCKREGYKDRLLGREHVSDNKKKLAFVSTLVGINQVDEEKTLGTFRLNIIKLRSDEYRRDRVVNVASCLAFSEPCRLSAF